MPKLAFITLHWVLSSRWKKIQATGRKKIFLILFSCRRFANVLAADASVYERTLVIVDANVCRQMRRRGETASEGASERANELYWERLGYPTRTAPACLLPLPAGDSPMDVCMRCCCNQAPSEFGHAGTRRRSLERVDHACTTILKNCARQGHLSRLRLSYYRVSRRCEELARHMKIRILSDAPCTRSTFVSDCPASAPRRPFSLSPFASLDTQ